MDTRTTAHDPTGDLVRIGLFHAAIVALPILVLGLVALPVWAALPIAVIAGVAVTVARARGADERIRRALGARVVRAEEVPRLAGAVEHVAMAVGVAPPLLHVIDDPARNAVVWASGRGPASIGVTTGLLEVAEPIELEGVVAHLLTDVRDGLVEAPTAATALFGGLAAGPLRSLARAGGDDRRIVLADLEGARAIRYPPGVVAALEKIRTGPPGLARSPEPLRALWFVAPSEPPPGEDGPHPPVDDRIDLLREM